MSRSDSRSWKFAAVFSNREPFIMTVAPASSQILRRVITCQGSIQLAAALSVMFQRDREQADPAIRYQNYLVIYDLYAPANQHEKFAAFVQKMATAVCDWTSIVYVTPETLSEIEQQIDSTPPQKISEIVHRLVGTATADEIYLCRNWQFSNKLFLNVYRSAQKICYGDGIGIYFSEHSAVVRQPAPVESPSSAFQQLRSWLGWKIHGLKHRTRKLFNLKTVLYSIPFDIGYFVLPNVFGEAPPMPTVKLDSVCLLEVFRRFTNLADRDYVSDFQAKIAGFPVSILLTSNLSEAKRLPQHSEITAYREFLIAHGIRSNSVLVIKPHPRDRHEKINALKSALSDLYHQILVLSEPELFFLPFEVFYLAAFPSVHSADEVRAFAVSSACLSLKLLFGLPSFIGFGSHLTTNLFNSDQVEARLEHEQILVQALDSVEPATIAEVL